MALPQQIVRDAGGIVSLYVADPVTVGTAPTISVFGPDGATYVDAQTAAYSPSVNTTLNGATTADASTATLAAVTNIVAGTRLYIGGGTTSPREHVRVRGVTGFVATLVRPLRYAHATGEAVVGNRIAYTVTVAHASALFFDGWAEVTYRDSASVDHRLTFGVECVRREHRRLCTELDVDLVAPEWRDFASRYVDPEDSLDLAYGQVMEHLGARYRVRCTLSSEAFVEATAWQFAANEALHYGPTHEPLRERYAARLTEALARLTATQPVDADQDARVQPSERHPYQSVRVGRT